MWKLLLAVLLVIASFPVDTFAATDVVKIITTGGTIAMKYDPIKKAPMPALSGEDLIATVPEITKYGKIEVENLANISSSYVDPDLWIRLHKSLQAALARPEIAGAIVTHGTNTLEETAYFVDLTINSSKPVVLIGSQRPSSERDFDGPRNLVNAVRICLSPEAKDKGAMIALNGQINAAREVIKLHNWSVETYQSLAFGFLGYVDDERVIFYRSPLRRQHISLASEPPLPYVEIVPMFAGANGGLVKAAADLGVKGIVIQSIGPGDVNVPMARAIKYAMEKGVLIVVSTRVPSGRVRAYSGYEGGGKWLKDAGAILADDLSPQKARILLMLAIQAGIKDPAEIQKYFDK